MCATTRRSSDDEPPRSHWAEILALAERLAESPSLLPRAPFERTLLFGLVHELLGERGLVWSGRLLVIHAGLTSDGQRGFPVFLISGAHDALTAESAKRRSAIVVDKPFDARSLAQQIRAAVRAASD